MLAVRRLLHHKPGDPKFGTYDTVKDADGNFQSTLRLIRRAQAAARLRKREYKGEKCRTKIEAEVSAARVFWDDPHAQEKAAKLPPSTKARRQRKRCAEYSAKRKAEWLGTGKGVDRKGAEGICVTRGWLITR